MAVSTTIALNDRMSGPLNKMMKSIEQTIRVMERMDASANNIDTAGLARARRSIENATADLARLQSAAGSAGRNGVGPLNRMFGNLQGPVNAASNAVRNFFASFAGAAAAYLSLQGIQQGFSKFVRTADEYVSAVARVSLINDGLQTQAELQDKIFRAAQRSGSAYVDMASSVAKLNLLAGDAFGSNDEAIRFSELMGKAFTVSGASTGERQAGMHQLTQAMASGRLQGDEFRSITENAPLLAHAIADAVGVSMGELRKLSSEGVISADIIKSALFGAADDIESKFKDMPITFATAMTKFKNNALLAFQPLIERFSAFVNSDAFTTISGHVLAFINILVAGMMVVFDVIEVVYSALSALAEYWPVMAAGLSVLLVIYFPLIMQYLNIMLIRLYMMIQPILAQAAAWMIAYWPITLIVAIVIVLIAVLMHFGVTTEQILGFVGGLFFALGATIWNIIAIIWNQIAMFAEFLINVFIDPTYAVQKLFYDLATLIMDVMAASATSFDAAADALANAFVAAANIAIGAINGVAGALNLIPGINIGKIGSVSAAAGSNFANNLKTARGLLKAPTRAAGTVSIPRMDMKNIPGAFDSGYKFGSNLKLPDFGMPDLGADMPLNAGSPGSIPTDLLDALGKDPGGAGGKGAKLPKGSKGKGAGNPTGGKLDSIGKIEDDISISDEDLKMLKELADIKSIQNFRTLQPSFVFGDMTIREEADINKIIKAIDESLNNSMNESTEGAYT